MKAPISLFLIGLVTSLPALADDNAGKTGGCKGFGFNGQFAKNMGEREGNGGKETVGKSQKDELQKMQDQLKQKFETCKAKVGQNMDIQGFDAIERRLAQAQNTHSQYVEDAKKLCNQVDQAQADTMKQADAMVADKNQSALTAFKNQSQLHGSNEERYAGLEKSAAAAKQNVEKGFPGNQADKDPRMDAAIQSFKENITRQTKYYSDQASRELKNRDASNSGEVVYNAVRFKTQADVDKFYAGLDYCRSIAKDLDKFNKKYQKLSNDLASAQKEVGEAGQKFAEWKAESGDLKKNLDGRAAGLDDSSKSDDTAKAAKDTRKPSQMNSVEGFGMGAANQDQLMEPEAKKAGEVNRATASEDKPSPVSSSSSSAGNVAMSALEAQKDYSVPDQEKLIEAGVKKAPYDWNPIANANRQLEGSFTGADGITYDVFSLNQAAGTLHYARPRK